MLHRKHAFITGGGSGMGRLHALRLAARNVRVTALDLNEAGLTEVASHSPNILTIHCDVTQLTQVRDAVTHAETAHGAIDQLINCAAIMPGGLLMEASPESLNRIMEINYGGMINVCQTVVPKMLERNVGDVIIYGSTAGLVPATRFGGYGVTKAANNFYAQVLMQENKGSKLRFQLVCPPAVDTPLIDQAKESGPVFLKDIQTTRKNMVSPEFVVDTVEQCLERGVQINYPGPAKWVAFAVRFFPGLVKRMAE